MILKFFRRNVFCGFSAIYSNANRGLMTDLRPCKYALKTVEEINAEVDWQTWKRHKRLEWLKWMETWIVKFPSQVERLRKSFSELKCFFNLYSHLFTRSFLLILINWALNSDRCLNKTNIYGRVNGSIVVNFWRFSIKLDPNVRVHRTTKERKNVFQLFCFINFLFIIGLYI